MRGKTFISSQSEETMKLLLVGFFTLLLFGASYSAGYMQMQMAEEIVEDVDFDFGENEPGNDVEEDDDVKTTLFALNVHIANQFLDQQRNFVMHRMWQHQKKCHPVITPPPEIA